MDIKLNKSEKNEVEKTLKELLEVCQIYRCPMFAGVMILNQENKEEYNNIVYSGQSHIINLFYDKIRRHMLIANGFEAIPPLSTTQKGTDGCSESGKKPTIYKINEENIIDIEIKINKVCTVAEKFNTVAFVSVAIENSDQKTLYKYKYYVPNNELLRKDKEIGKHISIEENLFEAVPKRETVSIDMQEVFGCYGQ